MEEVHAATGAAMDSLNTGVATVWQNQQQLEAEAQRLQQNTQRFAKQTGQWVAAFNQLSQSLKALGDVENWSRAIESDIVFIDSALQRIQAARQPDLEVEAEERTGGGGSPPDSGAAAPSQGPS